MRIKELFIIPEGEKVTEKMFGRVLYSSIVSILLCMACLVSTTWAWFSVSIESTDNKIVIATVNPKVTFKLSNGNPVEATNGAYELGEGEYLLEGVLESDATDADAFGARNDPLYLVLTVVKADKTESYFIQVDNGNAPISQQISVSAGMTAKVSFSVSWVQPATAKPIEGPALVIGDAPVEASEPSASEPVSP